MRIKNLPSISSMDGSQDALVIEQTDGSEDKSRKVSPAQIKQYVLGDMDEVPTQNSNNPVKSGGIFSTMAVPKYDATNRREYFEGGAAFDGNIDSFPTAGSNNAVSSGGTKTYVDNAVSRLNAEIDVINSKLTRVELNITSLEASSWTESSVSGLYFTRIALPTEYYGRTLISAILRRRYSGDNYTFIGNYNNFGTNDKDITIFSVTNNPRAIGLDLYYN